MDVNMLKRLSTIDFDEIFKILEDSFPLDEFRTKEEQLSLFSDSHYSVLGVCRDGKIVSIAAIWDFKDFLFVEHLATLREYRNCGIGKTVLSEIIKNAKKLVCLEVEPPIDELSCRRVEFYQRCGMHFNSYPYIQPSISKGRSPVPLFIMTSNHTIDELEFNHIKNLLYKNVYKI